MKSIENEYAYSTEVDLATLEELCYLKSSSKSRISRQQSICLRMLNVCAAVVRDGETAGETFIDFGSIDKWHPEGRNYQRVYRLLQAAKSEPEGMEGALQRHVNGMLERR